MRSGLTVRENADQVPASDHGVALHHDDEMARALEKIVLRRVLTCRSAASIPIRVVGKSKRDEQQTYLWGWSVTAQHCWAGETFDAL